jgi:hypothetical protein
MGILGNAKDKVGDFFGKLGDLKDLLTGALTDAINGIGTAFGTVFGGLWNVVKAPLNLIIGGINDLISGLDSIKFTVPGWVPGVGGKGFKIDIPKIPLLATGGDIHDNGPVIVGERGPEMLSGMAGARVTPLPAGLSSAAGGLGGSGGPITINITTRLDGRVVAQQLVQHIPSAVRNATGARAF